jgi:hypothetical protein
MGGVAAHREVATFEGPSRRAVTVKLPSCAAKHSEKGGVEMGFPPALLPRYTARLVLRRFDDSDLQPLVGYRSDPDVARLLWRRRRPPSG